MATKPTRQQQQACDLLAEALVRITEAARLDGKAPFGADDLAEVAQRLARATSAFRLDDIVARALERRSHDLGLRSGTADLLLLVESGTSPLEMLRLSDDEFKEKVAALEEELGEV